MKEKIEMKYWVSLVFSLACVFMIIDTAAAFSNDLYAVLMGQFITIPLGVVTVIIAVFIQAKETSKTKRKTYITAAGVILGIITALLPIVLFSSSNKNYKEESSGPIPGAINIDVSDIQTNNPDEDATLSPEAWKRVEESINVQ